MKCEIKKKILFMQGMGNIFKNFFYNLKKKVCNFAKKNVARMEICFITFFSILLIF